MKNKHFRYRIPPHRAVKTKEKKNPASKNIFDIALDSFDKAKRLILSLAVFLLTAVVLFIIIETYTLSEKTNIVIDDFQISNDLRTRGYSGELLSRAIAQKMHKIRNTANSYYSKEFRKARVLQVKKNNIILPDQTLHEYFKTLLKRLDRNTHIEGHIVSEDILHSIFTINGNQIETKGSNVNNITDSIAEKILDKIDPISLAAYYNSRRDKKCINISKQLLQSSDSLYKAIGYHFIGTFKLYQGKYDDARSDFNLALKYFTRKHLTSPTLNNLGVCKFNDYQQRKDKQAYQSLLDSAIYYFKSSIKADPGYYQSYSNLAILHLENQLDEAILFANKADSIRPNDSGILGLIGLLYSQKKDTLNSIKYFSKALSIEPIDPVAYYYSIDNKQRKPTIEELAKLKSIDKTTNKFYFNSVMKKYSHRKSEVMDYINKLEISD